MALHHLCLHYSAHDMHGIAQIQICVLIVVRVGIMAIIILCRVGTKIIKFDIWSNPIQLKRLDRRFCAGGEAALWEWSKSCVFTPVEIIPACGEVHNLKR